MKLNRSQIEIKWQFFFFLTSQGLLDMDLGVQCKTINQEYYKHVNIPNERVNRELFGLWIIHQPNDHAASYYL